MPWPIPTLLKVEKPKPVSWRTGLPMLCIVACAAAGSVLMLWPRGHAAHTHEFWIWLAGAPFVACSLAFGALMNRWEGATIQAEEQEREQARILSLWHMWCQRNLRVSAAIAITPVPSSKFDGANGDPPVNKDRAKGLAWTTDHVAGEQFSGVVSEISKRLKGALEQRRELAIVLLEDETPGGVSVFGSELKSALAKVAPDTRFAMICEPLSDCARWIARQVDDSSDVATLVVAIQRWPEGETLHSFSEGVAAILIEPAKTKGPAWRVDGTTAISSALNVTRLYRPMVASTDTLNADIAQMVEMQAASGHVTHFWHTGGDGKLSSAIQSAIEFDPGHPVVERSFDHAVGLPGPTSSWMMLATALEVAPSASGLQLLGWSDTASDRLHLCMIAPAAQKQDSEGKRSER